MVDESLKAFFTSAKLWRRQNDETSYQILTEMTKDPALPPSIRNRIAEIEHEYKKRNRSLRSDPVT